MATEITLVKSSSVITIGRQGESKVREIQFDIADWVRLYGDGTVQLLHKRPTDKTPYPVNVSVDEMSTVKWVVTGADTAYPGSGRAEMRYYVDDMLKVSKTWETIVGQTLGGGSSPEPPAAEQGWVDKVLQAGADAEDSAKRAANSEALANQFAQDVFVSVEQASLFSMMAEQAAEEAKKAAKESQGTLDHDKLSNRDFADAHPIAAITGLTKELKRIETIALQTCSIATVDTPGLIKPGVEFLVAPDGTMSLVSVEIAKIPELEEKLSALEAVDKRILSEYSKKAEVQATAKMVDYEISHKPIATIVNHYDHEIRIMCPEDTEWTLQQPGVGADSNSYYIGFKAYAPSDDVISFKEDLAEIIDDPTMYYFEKNEFAGTDEYGRKYSIVWLPVAAYDEDSNSWSYHGAKSSSEKYIGWYYSVEWYNAAGIKVAADTIRINLTNENCHANVEPFYVAVVQNRLATLEEIITWENI